MASPADTRLQFIVGKGGVGKSTLACALALESAAAGRRTLVVEFGGRGGVSRYFGLQDAPAGEVTTVRPGLGLLALEGDEALAEYLRLVVPIKRLLTAVFSSRLYRVFVAFAPGLKELMTVGKVWYEADRKRRGGAPEWERIFVDAGASGHSLQYLQMPAAAAAAFSSGLVHREAMRVQSLLADAASTRVHVVAVPEEMPVTEACAIVARLGELGLPVGELFLNRCRPRAPESVGAALDVLASLSVSAEDERCRDAMRDAAETALGWQQVQEAAASRLERETGRAATRLPLVVGEEFALADVERLVAMLREGSGSRREGDAALLSRRRRSAEREETS